MPETSVVSRRDFQEPKTEKSTIQQTAIPILDADGEHAKRKRTEFEGSSLKALLVIAERLSSGIDPTSENMTVGEFRFLRQINTALFALNIVNAGLPLNQMCQYLRDPGIGIHLDDNLINQDQAANIICFASVYGLYFQESNEELLGDLAALEYAIQMKAYSSETLQEVCESLDYQAANFLDIDVQGIQDKVCNGTTGIIHSTSISTASILSTATTAKWTGFTNPTPLFPSAPSTTGTTFGTYPLVTGTIFNPTSWTEWATPTTGSGSTGTDFGATSTIIFGSDGPALSSATLAAGTVGPWFNTTAIATADVTTVTASAVTESASASPIFYRPPRLVRKRVHRHG